MLIMTYQKTMMPCKLYYVESHKNTTVGWWLSLARAFG